MTDTKKADIDTSLLEISDDEQTTLITTEPKTNNMSCLFFESKKFLCVLALISFNIGLILGWLLFIK